MSSDTVNAALLVVRIALGVVFLAHGLKHLRNRDKTIAWAESIGLRQPAMQWMFMSFAEIGIGIGLAAGFLTSFAVAGLVAMMAGAFLTVHRFAGFWITARPDEGYEYVMVLTAAAVALGMLGPGEWSIDHSLDIAASFDGMTAVLLAAAGMVVGVLQVAAFYRRP